MSGPGRCARAARWDRTLPPSPARAATTWRSGYGLAVGRPWRVGPKNLVGSAGVSDARDPREPVVLRETSRAVAQWFFAVFSGLVGLLAFSEAESLQTQGTVLLCSAAWVVGLGAAAQRRIEVTSLGVKLRYCTHSRTLRWSEISGFQLKRRFVVDKRPVVVTLDAHAFPLPGIDRSLFGGQAERGWAEHIASLDGHLQQARYDSFGR